MVQNTKLLAIATLPRSCQNDAHHAQATTDFDDPKLGHSFTRELGSYCKLERIQGFFYDYTRSLRFLGKGL